MSLPILIIILVEVDRLLVFRVHNLKDLGISSFLILVTRIH